MTALLERDPAAAPAGHPGAGADEEFMRGLYQRCKPPLQAYVLRLTRDPHWAEDIVQATLIRAWQARQALTQGEAATRSWLHTTAYRIFIDQYRSRTARPATLTGDDIVRPGPDHADQLAWSVTLAQAMTALSPPHRQAVVHVYYLNHTADQAASILGISPGTVKSRLHYALRALRKQLTPALGCQQ